MNAINPHLLKTEQPMLSATDIEAAIAAACQSVAPTWPLDRFIAVNPYWGLIDRSFLQVHAELMCLGGSSLFMPREFYLQAFSHGQFSEQHIAAALAETRSAQTYTEKSYAAKAPASETVDDLLIKLQAIDMPQQRLMLLSDCVDAHRDLRHEPAWADTITHQLSQFCAAYFDDAQADWKPARAGNLFAAWRDGLIHDHSVAPLMHAPHIASNARRLPTTARAMIAFALQHFEIRAADAEKFLRAILLRINGWAAWCAYLRWQARLHGADDEHIVDLLAMRLAWECLLDDGERGDGSVWQQWQHAFHHADFDHDAAHEISIYQRALEIAFQSALVNALAAVPGQHAQKKNANDISAQAIFCIDVRSEVFRRALEQVDSTISTHGFAGFFGLPISYAPIGTDAMRPQLPGLLAPALHVTQTSGDSARDDKIKRKRQQRLAASGAKQPFQRVPASAFTLVESLGIGYAIKLVQRSFSRATSATTCATACDHVGLSNSAASQLNPRLQMPLDAVHQRADLAEKILRAMSLSSDLARIVLLVGHGSQSANNPHAAGLDCGACCGQTGEVNARALAALLNAREVRHALHERGVSIPEHTYFVAALHNTSTDEVRLFELEQLPATHIQDIARLQQSLAEAAARARAERAPQLGLAHLQNDAAALAVAIKKRTNDWAQTRPEWGLANNAAFIVAPRARTQHIDLHGRAFLHDYDWRADNDGSVLELIMTAPMIVTHWINMQYHASTVDNHRYGSGNKILHNVVGGHIGVFEGNGGDLRIGLPLQSLHDGERWMHTPLRLSVFIEAPAARIAAIIERHASVRHLVAGGWLHLFCIDAQSDEIRRCEIDRSGAVQFVKAC
ncbi:MAG: DUF2309 domain-containing protein [Spongiibacteraceae bacterium]